MGRGSASSGVSRLVGRRVPGREADAGEFACGGESEEKLSHEVFLEQRASQGWSLVTRVLEHSVLSGGLLGSDPGFLRSCHGRTEEKQWKG